MKTKECIFWEWKIPGLQKVSIINLTVLLLLLSVINVFASKSNSQTNMLRLDMKNSTVRDLVRNIEKQSDYVLLHSRKSMSLEDSKTIENAQSSQDIKIIKEKLYDKEEDSFAEEDFVVKNLVQKMNSSQGYWPDIDYDAENNANWEAAKQWERLYKLAVHYRNNKSSYYNSNDLRRLILNGVEFWNNERPQSANYWWNAIGVPLVMTKVCILIEKDMSESQMNKSIDVMKKGIKPSYYEYHGPATGQNLLWLAEVHLYVSCLSNDTVGLRRAISSVNNEIVISEKEGIQPDFSFHQHGHMDNTFHYGLGFAETAAEFMYFADNTSFHFSQEKIDIISDYLLKGMQWMSRYNYLEYTAMGRVVSRNNKESLNKQLITALNMMIIVDPSRKNEYQSFYNRLSNNKEKPLIGNKYFWRSDLMVHHREKYFFSVKTTSNRIMSDESGNGENLKGFYHGHGTYYLLRSGQEYNDILPVWNWRKLPELLSEQKSESLPLFDWGKGAKGTTSFVYGLSDDLYGCFTYDFNKDNVKAHRSWFLFDDEIVSMANSITGTSLYQSINQCIANGSVWSDKEEQGDIYKVFHDSIGYCVINTEGYPIEIHNESQEGSWKEINRNGTSDLISKSVFSMGINLGTLENAKTCYVILPGISLEKFKSYKLSDHVQILQNTNEVQAVYQKDIDQMQVVFYASNKIRLPWNDLFLKMKKPGLVMIKKINNNLFVSYDQPFLKKVWK